MAVNPVGYVELQDTGIPQTITVKAGGVVSGGEVVYAGSTAATISSGANSFAFGDVYVLAGASGTNYPIGIAKHAAASGGDLTIVTKGLVVLRADGGCSPGQLVGAINGTSNVAPIGSSATVTDTVNRSLGRAWSTAGSTEYCAVYVNL